jgi:hypothetical protein
VAFIVSVYLESSPHACSLSRSYLRYSRLISRLPLFAATRNILLGSHMRVSLGAHSFAFSFDELGQGVSIISLHEHCRTGHYSPSYLQLQLQMQLPSPLTLVMLSD